MEGNYESCYQYLPDFSKDYLMSCVIRWMNHSLIKEGVKTTLGLVSFGLGVESLYRFSQERVYSDYLEGYTCALAQFSFVLQAGVTPIGSWMISKVIHRLWNQAQLEKVFGPSGVFESNPWHLRHVTSLIALSCAIPAALGIIFRTAKNRDIKMRALFNVVISRPVLHQGNRLALFLFKT